VAVRIRASVMIDRPVDKVFRFYADEHVRNHPRWDPDIELWFESDAPLGVGSVIRRRNSRSGTPVEGTMQVVEFERNRAMAMVIHDGPAEMRGRATFEPDGTGRTKITTIVEIPGMDASTDTSFLTGRLERSAGHIKDLIEAELTPAVDPGPEAA
jgi:uncharacterized protein YndB with AHSA1/START domain